ncbi:MAG: ATP-binding cassette domain-containing protein [Micromonosporaceae bacterium]|nr:ATP-binding cassette domain-containing protein [Micromonosporaceae bacterium]
MTEATRPESPVPADGTDPDAAAAGRLRLEINDLCKEFYRTGGERVRAVDQVSVDVHPGEILVLLGPSGCGKSTLLRCVAGLEQPDRGRMLIDGAVVYDGEAGTMVPAHRRDVNMMFQSYALWPHMSLRDNVAYPLRVQGASRKQARAKADDYLELVGLPGLGRQYVSTISGGQQQRVALARTLINEPSVVLFDEPLSNVDAKVRSQLRRELLRIHQELGFAAVYVTHDQIEAMGLGTRIAILRDGGVEQLADPVTIYEEPATRQVAEFVGEANLIPARVTRVSGEVAVLDCVFGEIEIAAARLSGSAADGDRRAQPAEGAAVVLMVRPEHCRLVRDPAGGGGANSWAATVDATMYAGSRTEYSCQVGTGQLTVWELATPHPLRAGAAVRVEIPREVVRVVEAG